MTLLETADQSTDLSLAVAVSADTAEFSPDIDRLIEKQGVWSPEAIFCLQAGLTQAAIVRPILKKSVGELVKAGYLMETGGEVHNPHQRIDAIGAQIAYFYLPRAFSTIPLDLHIEEEKVWKRYPVGAHGDPRYRIVIDPLDGTNDIAKGRPFQAMGILVTDADGRFMASCVAGLRRPEILVVDGTHAQLFDFDEKRLTLTPEPLHVDAPVNGPIRVSVLKRRIEEQPDEYAFIDGSQIKLALDTFGGAGLLALAKGEIAAMLDRKGQVWYEAALWGMTAQQAGCPVFAPDGSVIDFARLLADSLANPHYNGRQKIVICSNQQVAEKLLQKVES
mgnify:FL=1